MATERVIRVRSLKEEGCEFAYSCLTVGKDNRILPADSTINKKIHVFVPLFFELYLMENVMSIFQKNKVQESLCKLRYINFQFLLE